jgi:hypothetical protein
VIINENATSANKKSISERPEMQKLISLIKQNKVHTLYAFDRTRLFRDHYEGMEFTDLRIKYDVHLVYTSVGNGHIPASDDIFVEGLLSMFSDIEGKNIARRSKEARRRYPPQKLGYKKEIETKKFFKDPAKKTVVEQYFTSIQEIDTIDELYEVLKHYRKELSCNDLRLISMARDPFYAADDFHKGQNKLRHVDPYLTLEAFTNLQDTKGNLFSAYLERIEKLETQNIYSPMCGYCGKSLNYRKDKVSNTAFYTCSRNHAKVEIAIDDLTKVVQLVLQEVINKLDSKKMIRHSVQIYKQIRVQFESEIAATNFLINEIMEELILDTDQYSADWREDLRYKKLSRLGQESNKLLKAINEKEHLLQENKAISEAVENYLHDSAKVNPSLLCSMFIDQMLIYQDEIEIEVFTFDYLQDVQTKIYYKGEETA